MSRPLALIRPGGKPGPRLAALLERALEGVAHEEIPAATLPPSLAGRRLLFVLELGEDGINPEYCALLSRLRSSPPCLEGCVAGLVVDGAGELYTKSAACELALAINLAGCTLVGRPLVEGTGSLANHKVLARTMGLGLEEAYRECARELVGRVMDFCPPTPKARPNVLALHASSHETSNTLALWREVGRRLEGGCDLAEIGLRNGAVSDCAGCPYTMCLHFGERGGCFYGGVMTDEVFPALRRADALVMLCPNYNDALSANLTAFINRLTALFRQGRFYDKALFAIVVSGYSGSDILARQLIAALNMNKSFYLPGRFALLETANDAGEALALPGVAGRLDSFAQTISAFLLEKRKA